jgi:dCMP deaminase
MEVAQVTAKRATCLRRSVGCVLLDKDGFILSTGYNGVASGMAHCNRMESQFIDSYRDVKTNKDVIVTEDSYPAACPGAFAKSGTNLDGCHAIHAEQNALLRCPDVRRIHTCFVTASPCMTCTKLLMNTGCSRIIFAEPYPHNEAQQLWESHGGEWIHYAAIKDEINANSE